MPHNLTNVVDLTGNKKYDGMRTNTPEKITGGFYHAANEYLGVKFIFNRGGFVEAIENGKLQYREDSESVAKKTDEEKLCGSKCRVGAIMAQMQNTSDNLPSIIGPRQVSVYLITTPPDEDISDVAKRDFRLLKEVRYSKSGSLPVIGKHHATFVFPKQVPVDINTVYRWRNRPDKPYFNEKMGERVKQAMKDCIQTGDYTSPIKTNKDNTI